MAFLIGMQLMTLALAQQSTNTPPRHPPNETHTPHTPNKPVLTKKQKRGLRMLGEVQIEAAALQPDMRAYIEWQASMGYQKFDLKKSNALLESAFWMAMAHRSRTGR